MRPLTRILRHRLYRLGQVSVSTKDRILSPYSKTFPESFQISKLNVPKFITTMPVLRTSIIASYEEVKSVNEHPDQFLIDVREPSELQETGTIPGSINIPLSEVEGALRLPADEFERRYGRPKPSLAAPIIFSCKAGSRSASAREVATKLGFRNTKTYEGGWLDWAERSKSN